MKTKMTLFANQTSETSKCNKLIDTALQLQESGKAEFSTSTNDFGCDTIGIRLHNSMVWYWFELNFEYDQVFFEKRYSMNTGEETSGFRTGFKFLRKLGFYKN